MRGTGEYVYHSKGKPMKDAAGEISLPREEIVRCRDCEYIFHREYNNGFEYHTCGYFDSEHAEVTPDGFCKWGERREDA